MIEGSKNKGDWSEFYTLIYLLAKRRINSADEKLNIIRGYYFPIIRIMRDEKHKKPNVTNHMEYVIKRRSGIYTVDIYKDSKLMKSLPCKDFQDEVDRLLPDIKAGKRSTHGERFLNQLYLERLGASSTDIADIKMTVKDTNTARRQDMGFSIKSYIGRAPTLFNASNSTNFIFEVRGLTDAQMKSVNSINGKKKIIDRIKKIRDYGGDFRYIGTSEVFSSNLMMIDSRMEEIISEMILYHYTTNVCDCTDIIDHMEKTNPIRYPREGFYRYKFKKFLCAKALGMQPSKEWGGMEEANGGYIAVKSDGEVLAYFLYDRVNFEQYLLDNTKFERASTSRWDFASIYKEKGKKYIKLNLDIRFKKNH